MKRRISRQSLSRGRKSSVTTHISNALSRARRDDSSSSNYASRIYIFLAAASLLIISSNFLIQKNHNDTDRWLRSSLSGWTETGTKPTHAPLITTNEGDELKKQFDPKDFHKKNISLPSKASVILFYNLFIPNDDEGVKHAKEVITEQLGQVASALRALEKDKESKSAALFYNLIGNERAFPEESMKALCRKLHSRISCKQIGFYETASESVTLQDIHDFCQSDDVADTRITYIHSKGSYHQTDVNTLWRRSMTDAVVHPDCLSPPNDRCNVCGAQFYTRFSTMYPGNMWTAKCSYIKNLLPPIEGGEYDQKKKESITKFLKYRLWGQINTALYDDRVDYYGLGRYRLEHWIGSHPSIEPCELHRRNVTFSSMIYANITPDHYEWGMGPRRYDVVDEYAEERKRIKDDEDAQFREYFYLPGNLLKWFTLYGSDGVPSQNHWAWDFFPAGQKWKEMVRRHGENAIEEMAMQSTNRVHSAYSSEHDEKEEAFQIDPEVDKLFSVSVTAPLVVFYHISKPKDKKVSAMHALKSQLEVLSMGQYDIISRSYIRQRPVILYYTTAENSTDIGFFTNMCKTKSKNLTCRKLGEVSSAEASGQTLHHLHNFCQAKPTSSVTYLSNMLPGKYGVNKTEAYSIQKIRAYTTAVTSNMCLKSRDKCNVCGAEFYPLPFNHFIGNMFTASCDYVKDLLPPPKFETAMNDISGEILVSQLRRAVTTELFPFTPQNLGLDQYSAEHWIGSHPDFEPCDVAPVRHNWFPLYSGGSYIPNDYTSSRAYDFMWADAPRRSSAPGKSLSRNIEQEALRKDDIIFREHYYLAGNLYRWYKLYSKAPPRDSWVWQWYPKGQEWMLGVKNHGLNVVTKLSEPFWDEGVPF